MRDECTANKHRYFVADCAASEALGTVTVIIVCTACGDVRFTKIEVAPPHSGVKLLKEQERIK